MSLITLDMMEYVSDAAAQAAYASNDATPVSYISQNDYDALYNGSVIRDGQALTLAACVIYSVKFYLYKFGFPTGNATAVIKASSGTVGTNAVPTGAALATSNTLDVSTLTGSFAWYEFPFATPYIHGGGDLCIELQYSGGDAGNSVRGGINTSGSDPGNHFQYVSSYAAQATWDDNYYVERASLQCFSEPTIITQGSHSLKGIAIATTGLNKTLTRTISPTIDLSYCKFIKFDFRASRTGSNIKFGFVSGATTELTPNILVAGTFQRVVWDISQISNANKNALSSFIVTVTNADANNTFYIDNVYAEDVISYLVGRERNRMRLIGISLG